MFIIIGILILGNEIYILEDLNGERILRKREEITKDRGFRYKIMTGIFSLILGIFRILGSIIY